jgi:hypothetical protein
MYNLSVYLSHAQRILNETKENIMNEKTAKLIAKENNLSVSSTKITILQNRFFNGIPAKRHEIKIGNVTCFYETDKGGSACWQIEQNGIIIEPNKGFYKSEAIFKAVNLQIN